MFTHHAALQLVWEKAIHVYFYKDNGLMICITQGRRIKARHWKIKKKKTYLTGPVKRNHIHRLLRVSIWIWQMHILKCWGEDNPLLNVRILAVGEISAAAIQLSYTTVNRCWVWWGIKVPRCWMDTVTMGWKMQMVNRDRTAANAGNMPIWVPQ